MSQLTVPSLGAGFRVKHTPYGTLITPRHSKWAWTPQELPFRSAIVRDGQMVSMGLPKFGGFRDEPSFMGDVAKVRAELERTGQLTLTEKRDGVLVIRSVIDGQVIFRTRRTHDGGAHRAAIDALVCDELRDPQLEPDRSLLFELTDPQWRIVIEYGAPQLTLLGAVDHRTLQLATVAETRTLGAALNLPTPQVQQWTGTWKALIGEITAREGVEGVVAVSADGQTLVKIKSHSYLRLHDIRFVAEGRMLVELWQRCGWKDLTDAERWLDRHGVSFELMPTLRERVAELIDTEHAAHSRADEIDRLLLDAQMKHPGKGSQALKVACRQVPDTGRPVLELLADGREQAAVDLQRRVLVGELLERWELEDGDDGS